MSTPYLTTREDGRAVEPRSVGLSSSPRAASRPSSAEIRPEFASAPGQPQNLQCDRNPVSSSHKQLPGIQSILNEQPGDVNPERTFWLNSSHSRHGSLYRHNSSAHSRSPTQGIIENTMEPTSRAGYMSPDDRRDPSLHGLHEKLRDFHSAPSRNFTLSATSTDVKQPNRRDHTRNPTSSIFPPDPTSSRSAASSTMPHYVSTKEIAGQGSLYVYSDGTTCKPVVNGRPVKRELGVTKLGNPRKRQAEACIACRTKKIKCERVGTARDCVHCAKQNLECRWARWTGQSPDSDADIQRTTDPQEGSTAPGSSYGSRVSLSPKQSPIQAAASFPSIKEEAPVDSFIGERFRKKRRLRTQTSDPEGFWAYHRGQAVTNSVMNNGQVEPFDVGIDPFVANPDVAMQLLGLYFTYRDDHTATIFPYQSFIKWCVECKSKSTADRMVLYAILALGSVFSTSVELKSVSQELAGIAKMLEQREFSKFSLQLAQARLHLTLYSWSKGFANHSFEYTDSGCRVLSALGYNTEEGCRCDASYAQMENDYEFTRDELIECRRRTFWLGYMTERYNGYCSGHLGIFANKDIWVALPNAEADYHYGSSTIGPLFNNGVFDLTNCGSFTLLIAMGSIWGDITADGYRAIYRPIAGYLDRYTSFYNNMTERLVAWEKALPQHYQYSEENTRQNIHNECFVTYYVIHACHLITAMKLNRYGRPSLLPTEVIRRNIKRTRRYARLLLELVSTVAKSDLLPPNNRPQYLDNAICQPFPGYAVLGACDILSSRGMTSALPEAQSLLGHARTIVSECARFFNSAKQQKKMIDSRLSELGAHVAMKHSGRRTWMFAEPLEKSFIPKDMDLIYSADEEVYFSALEEEEQDAISLQHVHAESPSTASETPIGLGLERPTWLMRG